MTDMTLVRWPCGHDVTIKDTDEPGDNGAPRCPYCKITELEQQLAERKNNGVLLNKTALALKEANKLLDDCETWLVWFTENNLAIVPISAKELLTKLRDRKK